MIPKSGYRFSEKIMLQELRLQVEGETDAEGVERFLQIDAHAARRRTRAAGGSGGAAGAAGGQTDAPCPLIGSHQRALAADAARGHPPHHSITSSARASSVGGISKPSALAVLRLMTSSYLVGACTGKSAGFSPLIIRST